MELIAKNNISSKIGFAPVKGILSIYDVCSEHHNTLFFCWNIRTGIDRKIENDRILAYINWYGEQILFPKLEIEEKLIFTILNEEHYLVKRAIKEHRRIRRLFKIGSQPMKNMICIEEELDLHIRFEERNILTEVEKLATKKQLKIINDAFDDLPTNSDWEDQFWI